MTVRFLLLFTLGASILLWIGVGVPKRRDRTPSRQKIYESSPVIVEDSLAYNPVLALASFAGHVTLPYLASEEAKLILLDATYNPYESMVKFQLSVGTYPYRLVTYGKEGTDWTYKNSGFRTMPKAFVHNESVALSYEGSMFYFEQIFTDSSKNYASRNQTCNFMPNIQGSKNFTHGSYGAKRTSFLECPGIQGNLYIDDGRQIQGDIYIQLYAKLKVTTTVSHHPSRVEVYDDIFFPVVAISHLHHNNGIIGSQSPRSLYRKSNYGDTKQQKLKFSACLVAGTWHGRIDSIIRLYERLNFTHVYLGVTRPSNTKRRFSRYPDQAKQVTKFHYELKKFVTKGYASIVNVPSLFGYDVMESLAKLQYWNSCYQHAISHGDDWVYIADIDEHPIIVSPKYRTMDAVFRRYAGRTTPCCLLARRYDAVHNSTFRPSDRSFESYQYLKHPDPKQFLHKRGVKLIEMHYSECVDGRGETRLIRDNHLMLIHYPNMYGPRRSVTTKSKRLSSSRKIVARLKLGEENKLLV